MTLVALDAVGVLTVLGAGALGVISAVGVFGDVDILSAIEILRAIGSLVMYVSLCVVLYVSMVP